MVGGRRTASPRGLCKPDLSPSIPVRRARPSTPNISAVFVRNSPIDVSRADMFTEQKTVVKQFLRRATRFQFLDVQFRDNASLVEQFRRHRQLWKSTDSLSAASAIKCQVHL